MLQCFHYVYSGKLSILDFQRAFVTAMGGVEDLKDVKDADLVEILIQSEEPDAGIMLFTEALKERSKIFVINGKYISEKVYFNIKKQFRSAGWSLLCK
jgi:hypothetical protein